MKPIFPLLTIVIFISFFCNSCIKVDYFPCVRGKGEKAETERYTQDFNQIDLRLSAQVNVSFGEQGRISITAHENVLDLIETRVSGNCLIIEQNKCIRSGSDDILIEVTLPELERIAVSGSGSVHVLEQWAADMIRLSISGSGNITAPVNTTSTTSLISGSGNIILTGSTNRHSISISGSGSVNGTQLISKSADIRISGSGHTRVAVEDRIEAHLSGSGNIYYRGKPSIQANISGTGSIIPF